MICRKFQKKISAGFSAKLPVALFQVMERQTAFFIPEKTQKVFGNMSGCSLLGIRKGGTDMDKIPNLPPGRDAPDEELIDTLIAISVVAKRLAEKLKSQTVKEEAFRCEPL